MGGTDTEELAQLREPNMNTDLILQPGVFSRTSVGRFVCNYECTPKYILLSSCMQLMCEIV